MYTQAASRHHCAVSSWNHRQPAMPPTPPECGCTLCLSAHLSLSLALTCTKRITDTIMPYTHSASVALLQMRPIYTQTDANIAHHHSQERALVRRALGFAPPCKRNVLMLALRSLTKLCVLIHVNVQSTHKLQAYIRIYYTQTHCTYSTYMLRIPRVVVVPTIHPHTVQFYWHVSALATSGIAAAAAVHVFPVRKSFSYHSTSTCSTTSASHNSQSTPTGNRGPERRCASTRINHPQHLPHTPYSQTVLLLFCSHLFLSLCHVEYERCVVNATRATCAIVFHPQTIRRHYGSADIQTIIRTINSPTQPSHYQHYQKAFASVRGRISVCMFVCTYMVSFIFEPNRANCGWYGVRPRHQQHHHH